MAKNLRLSLALGVGLAVLGGTAVGTPGSAHPLESSPAALQSGDRCQASPAKSGDGECPGEIWMGGVKGCGCAPAGTCSRDV
jgi:hypothetical protein